MYSKGSEIRTREKGEGRNAITCSSYKTDNLTFAGTLYLYKIQNARAISITYGGQEGPFLLHSARSFRSTHNDNFMVDGIFIN